MNNATVVVTGKIIRDPEHSVPKESTMLKFSVGVNTGEQDQDKKYITNFYNVTAWGKFAEYVIPHVHKGDVVTVTGNLTQKAYKKKDGSMGTSLEINPIKISTASMFDFNRSQKSDDDDDLPV